MQLGWTIIGLLTQALIIAMIEKTIATNDVRRDFNRWTYGQVSALALGSYGTLYIAFDLMKYATKPAASPKSVADTEANEGDTSPCHGVDDPDRSSRVD
ncbi:unnamed protein product [Rhizoctonia solani]|uniref:Uncharacterized protein n=1 Tax=Rhizoctonia solani TaxID=456999 RepID=A0A8H3DK79_9AGAM|nr:unnamed protein product [Rhizoctonia solani]